MDKTYKNYQTKNLNIKTPQNHLKRQTAFAPLLLQIYVTLSYDTLLTYKLVFIVNYHVDF